MDERMKESIASLMKDRNQRDALAEMLVEFIQPNHITVDFVNMLLDARSLKPGDSLVKKLRKGMKVRTLVPGTIHLGSEITVQERVNYQLDGADIKVNWNLWEMENGEIGTVDEIRGEMLAKLRDYYQNKVFTALSTVWSAVNTPDNYTDVGGVITATALENAIDYINDTAGGVQAVVGVRSLMTPITKFGAFWDDGSSTVWGVDSQLEQAMREGFLGRYYGANLVALNQIRDNPEDYTSLLPEDKILVIGKKVGEFITYDIVKEKMYDDMRPTPPMTFLELWQQFALMVWNASGIYVLKVDKP